MPQTHWQTCLKHLERELPAEDFNTWIRPLQIKSSRGRTVLLAPNEYVRDYISLNHLERIRDIFEHLGASRDSVVVDVSRSKRRCQPTGKRAPVKRGYIPGWTTAIGSKTLSRVNPTNLLMLRLNRSPKSRARLITPWSFTAARVWAKPTCYTRQETCCTSETQTQRSFILAPSSSSAR